MKSNKPQFIPKSLIQEKEKPKGVFIPKISDTSIPRPLKIGNITRLNKLPRNVGK